MKEYYIGIMSGTSLDGIDTVLVEFKQKKPFIIHSLFQPFSVEVKEQLKTLVQTPQTQLKPLGELGTQLGKCYACSVNALLKEAKLSAEQVSAIGCHGQTIFHSPEGNTPFTMQIGDGAVLHAETNIPVVNDFRSIDVAQGGQGAPLVPAFHRFIMQNEETDRVVLNLGGIANISILWKDNTKPSLGFDTGPGNTLMDLWIQLHQQTAYDEKGKWAATGSVRDDLLNQMLQDPYFRLAPPKSTGREAFNLHWLKNHLSKLTYEIRPEDTQRTLVQLTAQTISNDIKVHGPSKGEIWICGGGSKNTFLINQIQQLCSEFIVKDTAEIDIHPDFMEAVAFAWLARQRLKREKIDLTQITGARKPSLLGNIIES